MELHPGDLLIARLWRWDVERLKEDAEADRTEQVALGFPEPDYSVSVFGIKITDEDAETQMRRLCGLIKRSAKWVTFTTATSLEEAGFEVRLREPPANHYDVVIGVTLEDEALARLAHLFDEHGRRRFPACTA